MSVIRVNKTKDYTVMSNYHFRDKRLSLKAKGLLSEMLSLPNNWDYTVMGLVSLNKESKSAIQSTLKELEDCGYLIRTRTQDQKGQFDYIYDIYENPVTEKPQTENQVTDNPCTENQPQYNTNIINTNNKVSKDKISNKEIDQEFAELWNEYPRKQGKENALKSYIKARKDGVDKSTVLAGIKAYKAFLKANKTDSKYIKQGSTWFNQHCWEDDYSIGQAAKVNNAEDDDLDFLKGDWE